MNEQDSTRFDSPGGTETTKRSRRRRLFRRTAILGILGALAGGVTLKAVSHGGPGFWHHGGMHDGFFAGSLDPAAIDQRIGSMVKHLAVEIDATAEQEARLAEIAKATAHDLAPLREQLRTGRAEAMALFAAPTIDRAAAEQLRAQQLALAETVSHRLTQALADAAEVLTPEQRQSLAERVQRHRITQGWHHGRFGGWHHT